MNQLILTELDPRAWRAQLPGEKRGGRTIAAIFAHLHNCRLNWLRNSAPHLKCPAPLDPDRCTIKQASAAHRKSGAQCLRMLTDALSASPESSRGKIFARELGADVAGGCGDVCLHVLARGASSRADIDAGAPIRLSCAGYNSRRMALGEALETSWACNAPALSESCVRQDASYKLNKSVLQRLKPHCSCYAYVVAKATTYKHYRVATKTP